MVSLSRRKVLALSGSAAIAGLVAGCAATPAPAPAAGTAAGAAPAQVTQPEATTGEKAHLIALMRGDGNDLRAALQPFTETHPDIEVEVIGVAGTGYDEKTDLLIAGGDAPALWFPAQNRGYRYYADKDMFPDIGPLIERDGYDVEDFFTVLYEFVKWEGKQRGFPSSQAMAFIVYNKTLIESAAMEPPPADWNDPSWTWDRWLEIAKAVTKPDPDPMKSIWGAARVYANDFCVWMFGGDYFTEEDYVSGKPTQTIVNSPEVVDALTFMQDAIYEHQVQPSPADSQMLSSALGVDVFLGGKAAMTYSATWNLPAYGEIEEFEWGIAPIPGSPAGRKVVLYPDQWMMFKDQENLDAAWEVLKYIVGVDGMRLQLLNPYAGAIPSRSSLAEEWDAAASAVTGLDASTLHGVVIEGADNYGHITPSHAVIRWAEAANVAIYPNMDNLLLGNMSPEEAATQIESQMNAVLAT